MLAIAAADAFVSICYCYCCYLSSPPPTLILLPSTPIVRQCLRSSTYITFPAPNSCLLYRSECDEKKKKQSMTIERQTKFYNTYYMTNGISIELESAVGIVADCACVRLQVQWTWIHWAHLNAAEIHKWIHAILLVYVIINEWRYYVYLSMENNFVSSNCDAKCTTTIGSIDAVIIINPSFTLRAWLRQNRMKKKEEEQRKQPNIRNQHTDTNERTSPSTHLNTSSPQPMDRCC